MQINGIEVRFAGDPEVARLRCVAYLDFLTSETEELASPDGDVPP